MTRSEVSTVSQNMNDIDENTGEGTKVFKSPYIPLLLGKNIWVESSHVTPHEDLDCKQYLIMLPVRG